MSRQEKKYFILCNACWGFLSYTIQICLVIRPQATGKVLIHSANPQPRPVVIIVFTHIVRTSVRPHFSNSNKTKQFSSGSNVHYFETVVLTEWIIDLVYLLAVELLKSHF